MNKPLDNFIIKYNFLLTMGKLELRGQYFTSTFRQYEQE